MNVPARDLALDVARGIAIVLVVFGHSRALVMASPALIAAIFLFHVPLFFLLSGRVMRTDQPSHAGRALARRLLLPALLAALLVGAAKCVTRGEPAGETLLGILWATGQTLPWSHLWFLPALFLALMATQILAVPLRDNASAWGSAVVLIAGAAALLPLADYSWQPKLLESTAFPPPVGLPWSIDLLPLCLVFVWAGRWLRVSEVARRVIAHPLSVILSAVVFAAGIALARADLNLRVFSPFPWALFAAMAGCVLTLRLSQGLIRFAPLARPLAFAGRHSLAIFILHMSLQKALLRLVPLDALPAAALGAVAVAAALVVIALSLFASVSFDYLRARVGRNLRPVAPTGAR